MARVAGGDTLGSSPSFKNHWSSPWVTVALVTPPSAEPACSKGSGEIYGWFVCDSVCVCVCRKKTISVPLPIEILKEIPRESEPVTKVAHKSVPTNQISPPFSLSLCLSISILLSLTLPSVPPSLSPSLSNQYQPRLKCSPKIKETH